MAYLSQPSLSGSNLYFISEEDLWMVPLEKDLRAIRLTSGQGPIASPRVSPDDQWIALAGEEEGNCEVYLVPAQGGELRRMTFLGGWSYPIGWLDRQTILFKTNAKNPHRMFEFFTIRVTGGLEVPLQLGEGTHLAVSESGAVVMERNMVRADPAYWKRYRGGTAGQLWVSLDGFEGEFKRLNGLKGNLSCPVLVGDRIYFLSDENGLGRIHSCRLDGSDVVQHPSGENSEFYFRNLTGRGDLLAYQSAGDLFLFDTKKQRSTRLEIQLMSDRVKGRRKNVSAQNGFRNFSLQPQGERVLLEFRGKIIQMAHWSGPVTQIGRDFAHRYKLPDWLPCGKRLLAVRDSGLTEDLQIFSDRGEVISTIQGNSIPGGFGRIIGLKVAPRKMRAAISNHRNELIHVDLETGESRVLYRNSHHMMTDFDWSPDGKFLAFAQSLAPNRLRISIADIESMKIHPVTESNFEDFSPSFDPEGKYLYFISRRAYNPIYDDAIFDMTFAKARLPMLVVLKRGEPLPFFRESTLPESLQKNVSAPKPYSEVSCDIDFDGIEKRVFQFPVSEAKYTKIQGYGRKVLWSYEPVEGTLELNPVDTAPQGKEYVDCFDFDTGSFEYFGTGVSDFRIRPESGLRIIRTGNQLRILKATEKPDPNASKEPSSKSGLLDLSRAQIMVEPKEEWIHMFKDAWRQQKEYFWKEDLGGVDWDAVYRRYEPILSKISCRREFSDLIWEVIGELGTSHAYERGGDYRGVPVYAVGLLGSDLRWDPNAGGYEILRVHEGDSWNLLQTSPLRVPGVALKAGDLLLEIGGVRLSEEMHPLSATLNQSGKELWIRFKRKGRLEVEEGLIRTLKSESALRYRDWVNEKRARVKKASNGRLGYIHIPNMVGQGFAEFHRNFIEELECEGLVVDVRYNSGGHISQLILDRLARKPLGRDDSRWLGSRSIPYETPRKTVIAVTNEYAGSDGDIFSHTFKMRKIGKLVGTRTWGGVVGIWPRNQHIDGGYTTQPEFSTWFPDVEYSLENYGTEPDTHVEFPPHAVRMGEDPQLDHAIQEALKEIQ
jgi:tricorn protease